MAEEEGVALVHAPPPLAEGAAALLLPGRSATGELARGRLAAAAAGEATAGAPLAPPMDDSPPLLVPVGGTTSGGGGDGGFSALRQAAVSSAPTPSPVPLAGDAAFTAAVSPELRPRMSTGVGRGRLVTCGEASPTISGWDDGGLAGRYGPIVSSPGNASGQSLMTVNGEDESGHRRLALPVRLPLPGAVNTPPSEEELANKYALNRCSPSPGDRLLLPPSSTKSQEVVDLGVSDTEEDNSEEVLSKAAGRERSASYSSLETTRDGFRRWRAPRSTSLTNVGSSWNPNELSPGTMSMRNNFTTPSPMNRCGTARRRASAVDGACSSTARRRASAVDAGLVGMVLSPHGGGEKPMLEVDTRRSVRRSVVEAGLVTTMFFEESHAVSMKSRRPPPLYSLLSKKTVLGWCDKLLSNKIFATMMTLLTVFVLVGDDIRVMCFEANADVVFDWITGAALFLFSFEMILAILVREDYFPGFWFVADLVASASLIFDLTFVSSAMITSPEISSESFGSEQTAGGFEESEYARATRGARVGSRVARILRVLRLARLSRVMQCCQAGTTVLFKLLGRNSLIGLGPGEETNTGDTGENPTKRQSESRVGKKLAQRTPQRVIMIVLALLFSIPQLQPGASEDMMPASAQYGADIVFQAWHDLELVAAEAAKANDSAVSTAERQRRQDWETQTLSYIYYHAYDDEANWLFKLCWVGFVKRTNSAGDGLDLFSEAFLGSLASPAADDDDEDAQTDEMGHMASRVPKAVFDRLRTPWTLDCSEAKVTLLGVSLDPVHPCPRRHLRDQETVWYMPVVHDASTFRAHFEGQFIFVFDVRRRKTMEAVFGIVQTFMVVVVLAIGAFVFSKDVDRLVLLPIERMIEKVKLIRRNPLYATQLSGAGMTKDNTLKHNSIQKHITTRIYGQDRSATVRRERSTMRKTQTVRGERSQSRDRREKRAGNLETKMLENTIVKLGSLLALGFGEAGIGIIAENLEQDNADVTAKIPGTKGDAIFGFCQIRHFHITTEILKDQTVVFVNRVAAIVHRVVDEHLGAANRNFGQAFLLIWQLSSFEDEIRSKIADLSVMAFIKVVSELGRDLELAQMREHPLLLSKLPNARGVNAGFGLHCGWAIAGAIGSEFKIDASYLSPHVNLASQLEAATPEYGSCILLSEALMRICNKGFSRHFRCVDHVQLQGSKKATKLFTVDLNTKSLIVNRTTRRKAIDPGGFRQRRMERKAQVLSDGYKVQEEFFKDKQIWQMRQHLTLEFFQEFERGFLNYLAGEWDVAAEGLRKTRTMRKCSVDAPSDALLKFMEGYGFQAPAGWPGWRKLGK